MGTLSLTAILTPRKLAKVRKEVWDARAEWFSIGLELGLDVNDLENIKSEGHNHGDRLTMMLTLWLRQRSLVPSWGNLMRALRSKVVKNEAVAHEIENRLKTELARSLFLWVAALASILLLAILGMNAVVNFQPSTPVLVQTESSTHQQDVRPSDVTLANCVNSIEDLPSRPIPFIGRDEDVKNITNILLDRHNYSWAKVIGVYGLPAIGKTWLATYIGHEMADRWCFDVRFIEIKPEDPLIVSLFDQGDGRPKVYSPPTGQTKQAGSEILERSTDMCSSSRPMNPPKGKHTLSPPSLFKWAESLECETLLILDGCDPLLENSSTVNLLESLTKLIKNAPKLHILTTSQHRYFIPNVFLGHELKNLSDSAAVELLQKKSSLSDTDAMTVAQLLGNHPCALSIIGGIVSSFSLSGNEVIEQLQEDPLVRDAHNDEFSTLGIELYRVLSMSYTHYMDNSTRDCSYYITVFPGSFSTKAALTILTNFTKVNNCLKRLQELSLIDSHWYDREHWYRFHRLVREFFKQPGNNFETPLSGKDVNCSFASYYLQVLEEFVLTHSSSNSSFVTSDVRRFIYNSHNFRQILTTHSNYDGCRGVPLYAKVLIMWSLDLNNLLLLVANREQVGQLLIVPAYPFDSVHFGTVRYPSWNSHPIEQCAEEITANPHVVENCCDICHWMFGGSCDNCSCMKRQPSENWPPVKVKNPLCIASPQVCDTQKLYNQVWYAASSTYIFMMLLTINCQKQGYAHYLTVVGVLVGALVLVQLSYISLYTGVEFVFIVCLAVVAIKSRSLRYCVNMLFAAVFPFAISSLAVYLYSVWSEYVAEPQCDIVVFYYNASI